MTLTFSFLTLKPSKRYKLGSLGLGLTQLHPFPESLGRCLGLVGQGDYVCRSLLSQLLRAPRVCTLLRVGMQAGTVIAALGHVSRAKHGTMSGAAFAGISVNCPDGALPGPL